MKKKKKIRNMTGNVSWNEMLLPEKNPLSAKSPKRQKDKNQKKRIPSWWIYCEQLERESESDKTEKKNKSISATWTYGFCESPHVCVSLIVCIQHLLYLAEKWSGNEERKNQKQKSIPSGGLLEKTNKRFNCPSGPLGPLRLSLFVVNSQSSFLILAFLWLF